MLSRLNPGEGLSLGRQATSCLRNPAKKLLALRCGSLFFNQGHYNGKQIVDAASARDKPIMASIISSFPCFPSRHYTPVWSSGERQLLFNRIAPVYDSLNDLLSLGQHRIWKRMTVSWSGVKKGDNVLDLCCGSGDLAFLLSEKVGLDGKVTGLDFSKEQLLIASTRQDSFYNPCYRNIVWVEGDALDLPFPDSHFNAITMGYGIRNVVDRHKAMEEIFRVLKPGSRASILDFNRSTNAFTAYIQEWMIDNVVVPVGSIYGLAEEYAYLKNSIINFLTGKELEKLAKDVGFAKARHYEIGGGLMGNLVVIR